MKRFLLKVAYDGTEYCGFQIQKEKPTIEGELNKALSKLTGEEIRVIGASRTDAGVHALCNVAVFDSETTIPAEKLPYALNPLLPDDIVIQEAQQVPEDFHPRHCNSRKTYEYRITVGAFANPLKSRYAMQTYHTLDVDKMRQAAEYLIGEHDFNAFCATAAVVETTVRTVYEVNVRQEGSDVVIRVSGNGFLYNMVRIIAGTLGEVGRGRWTPEKVREILDSRDRTKGGPTAPAQGLTLVNYDFEGIVWGK